MVRLGNFHCPLHTSETPSTVVHPQQVSLVPISRVLVSLRNQLQLPSSDPVSISKVHPLQKLLAVLVAAQLIMALFLIPLMGLLGDRRDLQRILFFGAVCFSFSSPFWISFREIQKLDGPKSEKLMKRCFFSFFGPSSFLDHPKAKTK
jgi:MFS family permease